MAMPDWLRALFIVRLPAPGVKGPAAAAAAGGEAGAFVTPQSLVTFPMAAATVRVIWELAKALCGARAQTQWIPLAASLLVGAVVLIINLDAAATTPRNWRQWIVVVFIAFVNSLFLCAAALGIPIGAEAGHNVPAAQ